MCCNLRTHVIVISIICLIFTGLGSLRLISTVTTYLSHGVTTEASLMYGGSMGLALAVQILLYAVWLVSEILCIIGAMKNNKCMIIPFIIVEGLQIVACIGFVIFFIFLANQSVNALANFNYNDEFNEQDYDHIGKSVGGIFFYFLIIPLLIALGLTIYFLTIAIKFYQELSSGVVRGQTDGVVLQPYTTPNTSGVPVGVPLQSGGQVATVYVPPGTQNVTYAYQQQPPSYAQTQQGYAYPTNNPEMKNPA